MLAKNTVMPYRTNLSINRLSVTHNYIVSVALLISGSLANIFAYNSFEPLLAVVLIYFLGLILLYATPLGGVYERKMFRMVFGICWFMVGIASVYANYLNNSGQNSVDASWFFGLVTSHTYGRSLEDFRAITEGAGAVVIWRAVYDAFAFIGLEKGRYLGLLVNVFSVALTGVIAVKIACLVYGKDASRLNRLIILFSMCGLFWLFAANFLRDSLVLLSVTALAYVWTRYLARPYLKNLIFLVGSSVFAFIFLGFVRAEFIFVPLAMIFAGVVVIFMFDKSIGIRKVIIYIFTFIGMMVAGFLFLIFQDDLFMSLIGGYAGYLEESTSASSPDSLGMTLIVNQQILLRLIFGSVYIYVFPIPFWSGLQLESAYHLFKSLNALFFYTLIPLVALSFLQIVRQKAVRTPVLMFQLFMILGFTLAIASTSLENRHLGAFLVPLFVLALLPDLTLRKYRHLYKIFLVTFLFMMTIVHIAWLAIKL